MDDDWIEICLPVGDTATPTYPISHGTRSYRPYLLDPSDPASGWRVKMPREHAVYFVHNCGFYLPHG